MYLITIFLLLHAASNVFGYNIVLVITDDLDSTLDGMTPLPVTRNLIGDQGATFKNCFVASPICCPNRASILTGKYQHNHKVVNNSIEGGCSSRGWQQSLEQNTFATILRKEMGFQTFYAGKYMNQYGTSAAGGINYVPPGWDSWFGLVGNSKYYDYSLSVNGTERKYGHNPADYLTDVLKSSAVSFINSQKNSEKSFLMVLAPPAPHSPFIPAGRHNDKYKNTKAKRTPSFNTDAVKDKHWLVRMGPWPLPSSTAVRLDEIYRRRWETLAAVDEMVSTVYQTLNANKMLEKTYFIFTSDNGYHIGQFSMPDDKRQPYETDIKVPLLIRGPGIAAGSVIQSPVSSVDLFATILAIAGVERTSDGTSVLNPDLAKDRALLIEYRGEKSETQPNTKCPSDRDLNLSHCDSSLSCKCQDSANNTYACVRRVSPRNNNLFCVFEDDERFVEAYDLFSDEYQMTNIGYTMNRGRRYRFRKRLKQFVVCEGAECVCTGQDA